MLHVYISIIYLSTFKSLNLLTIPPLFSIPFFLLLFFFLFFSLNVPLHFLKMSFTAAKLKSAASQIEKSLSQSSYARSNNNNNANTSSQSTPRSLKRNKNSSVLQSQTTDITRQSSSILDSSLGQPKQPVKKRRKARVSSDSNNDSSIIPTTTTSTATTTATTSTSYPHQQTYNVIHTHYIYPQLRSRANPPLDLNTVRLKQGVSEPPPKPNRLFGLQEVPVFRPTLHDFQNPLKYISSIATIGKKYGAVKIIPPQEWNPQFSLDTEVCACLFYLFSLF